MPKIMGLKGGCRKILGVNGAHQENFIQVLH